LSPPQIILSSSILAAIGYFIAKLKSDYLLQIYRTHLNKPLSSSVRR